ncbi:MAG: DivIVA domain-containing protein [Vicinamibacterales bacterium]
MNVSPLDLRQQKFKSAMRGYDRGEVDALLTAVADDYEDAIREADRMRDEVARLEGLLAEHRSEEKSLKNTLLSAQRLADELREKAEADAQRIVRDAEARADLLLQKAQTRHEDLQREIDGLRARRRETETSVEAIINALKNTLDFVREQDQKEREDKIRLLRPRGSESGTGISPAVPATAAAPVAEDLAPVRTQNG